MNRLRRFFATHKTFVISIGFLVAFSVTVARATPPTSPYTAGATLDPQCVPGTTNCTVQVSPWVLSNSTLFSSTNNVAIGTVSQGLNTGFVAGAGSNLSFGSPSENSDPISFYRYNVAADISSLRLNLGDNALQPSVSDFLDIGATDNSDGLWHSAMTVYSDGKVGIGTTNPTSLLTISGAGTTMTVGGNALFSNSVTVIGTLQRAGTSSSWPNPGVGIFGNGTGTLTDSQTAASTTLPNANVGYFGIDTLAAANTGVNYTNASSVYIAGAPVAGTNVSITNPYALYVAGGESFFGGDITASYIGGTNGLGTSATASTITNFFASGGTTISGTTSNSTLQFAGSSNIQSRVDFGGNNGGGLSVNSNYSNVIVGSAPISTPGAGVNALLANLVVNPIGTVTAGGGGSITNTATLYIGGAATAPVTGANYALDVASGLSQFGSTSVTTGTTVAQFQNAGGTCDVTPDMTGGVICTSDMNLKKNITNLSDGSAWNFNTNISPDNQTILGDILALKPVDYNWNVEANGAQKHAGFIAQEVQQVFPDLVSTNPNTGILSLDYTGLVPYTVAALQQMNFNITNIDDLTKSDTWRDAIEQWLADSANGIQSIFSQQVVTPSLCVGTNGDMTCITKAQLDQLLSNQGGTTTVTSAPITTSSPSSTPPSESDTSSQTPDITAPVVTPPDQNQSTDTTSPDITTGAN